MRVIKEFRKDPIVVQVFSWNGKLMVKLEYGPYEQWFKFREEDITMDAVLSKMDDTFFEQAEARFLDMHKDMQAAAQRNKQ